MGGYSIKSGRVWQIPLNPEVYEMTGKADDVSIDDSLATTSDLKLSNNLKNAAEDHRPRIIIFSTDVPAKNSAIAAPDQREWVPMSSGRYPKRAVPPPLSQVSRRISIVSSARMNRGFGVLPLAATAGSNQQFTGVSAGASGR